MNTDPTADLKVRVFISSVQKELEEERNQRQVTILKRLAAGEELTSAQMQRDFSVTRDTVARDMATLLELKLAQKTGKARATRYIYVQSESSGIVR
jgi:predicted DNA-binding transcriptional regulator YafY